MNARDFKRLKKIAEERGGGEKEKRPNRLAQIKRRAKHIKRLKIGIGRTILVKDNEVL